MAAAMILPEEENKGGRGKKNPIKVMRFVADSYVDWAQAVRRLAPEQVPAVIAGFDGRGDHWAESRSDGDGSSSRLPKCPTRGIFSCMPNPGAELELMINGLKAAGLTRREIVKQTGLSRMTIWRAGIGEARAPSHETFVRLDKLCRKVGVAPDGNRR